MMRWNRLTPVAVLAAAASTAGVVAAACGGFGAESRERFSAARVISQETDNGATPMFLALPGGGRAVAWVSAARRRVRRHPAPVRDPARRDGAAAHGDGA